MKTEKYVNERTNLEQLVQTESHHVTFQKIWQFYPETRSWNCYGRTRKISAKLYPVFINIITISERGWGLLSPIKKVNDSFSDVHTFSLMSCDPSCTPHGMNTDIITVWYSYVTQRISHINISQKERKKISLMKWSFGEAFFLNTDSYTCTF